MGRGGRLFTCLALGRFHLSHLRQAEPGGEELRPRDSLVAAPLPAAHPRSSGGKVTCSPEASACRRLGPRSPSRGRTSPSVDPARPPSCSTPQSTLATASPRPGPGSRPLPALAPPQMGGESASPAPISLYKVTMSALAVSMAIVRGSLPSESRAPRSAPRFRNRQASLERIARFSRPLTPSARPSFPQPGSLPALTPCGPEWLHGAAAPGRGCPLGSRSPRSGGEIHRPEENSAQKG